MASNSYKQRVRPPRRVKRTRVSRQPSKQTGSSHGSESQRQAVAPPSRQSRRPVKQAHEIWGISEILEQILESVPMRKLLHFQRVCSGWRQLISSSSKLQKALFMRPDQSKAGSERVINPLFCTSNFDFMPMFECLHRMAKFPWTRTPRQSAFLYERASWRRMLLTQPPFTSFRQVYHTRPADRPPRSSDNKIGVCQMPDGIYMGYLYDITELELRDHEPGRDRSIVFFYYLLNDFRPFYIKNKSFRMVRNLPEVGPLLPRGDESMLIMRVSTTYSNGRGRRGILPDPPNEFESQGREKYDLDFDWSPKQLGSSRRFSA